LRRVVLGAMGDLAEDDATLRESEEHAAHWLADPASVDEDTAAVAVDLASRHAGNERFAALLAIARNGKTKEDRVVAMRALGGFEDTALLRRALDAILDEQTRAQDVRYTLLAAMSRRTSRPIVEAWVRARWDDLRKKLPGSLSSGLVGAAGIACTKNELAERTACYTPRTESMEGGTRLLAQSLEAASLCVELRASGAASLTRDLMNGDKKK
jgi:hypothetical protein